MATTNVSSSGKKSNHRQQQQEGLKQTHHVKFGSGLEPRSGRGVRNPPPGKENAIHAGHTAGAAARSTESPATKVPPRGRVKGPLSKVSRPSSGSSASRDKLKSSKETHAPRGTSLSSTWSAASSCKKGSVCREGIAKKKLCLVQKNTSSSARVVREHLPDVHKASLYAEDWCSKQERAFTKWLNHILAPVDPYGQEIHVRSPKVAAMVTTPAQTSSGAVNGVLQFEESDHDGALKVCSVSSRSAIPYGKQRELSRLRRSGLLLYQSEPLCMVLGRLEVEVECGRLRMHGECAPHVDVGVRQDILHLLLLSYNPVWLQLGLETVFGEAITSSSGTSHCASSSSTTQMLGSFILERMVHNTRLSSLYNCHNAPHKKFKEGYGTALCQFLLKKFLQLVLLLDRAKLTRLMDHDPCLFLSSSPIKSSRDLLLTFSRRYLSGEGDITKHLAYIGYTVTHVQNPLDEFQYAVKNISTDLRDGIRLARLTEMLTGNWKLSHQLRLPASTKAQRLHNMQCVFKALSEHMPVPPGLAPLNIVDGHREKTLALLWAIAFNFKVRVQVKEKDLREEIEFLSHQRLHPIAYQYQNPRSAPCVALETGLFFDPLLALMLQWCRAVCQLYGVPINNFNNSFSDGRALCYLIHHYHPQLLPLQLITNETTLTQSQPCPEELERPEDEEESMEGWVASFSPTTGKATWRDKLIENERCNFKLLAQKVTELCGVPLLVRFKDMSNTLPDEKVVIMYVAYLCEQLLVLRKETRAVLCIQRAWRSHLHRRQKLLCVRISDPASTRKCECHDCTLCSAALCLQKRWRARVLARKHVASYCSTRQAVVVCQATVKGWLLRRKFAKMNDAATVIQSAYRSHQQRARYLAMRRSCVLIQGHYRAILQRREYISLQRATICLQSHTQRWLVLCTIHRMQAAASVIQAHTRGFLLRARLEKMRQAAVVIQRCWRGYKEHFAAAVKIQAWVKGCLIRGRFVRARRAAVAIQAALRGTIARRHFTAMRCAVVILQAATRGFLARRRFTEMKRAAVLLQSVYRMHQSIRKYRETISAVYTLQRFTRCYLERKRYLTVRNAISGFQSHARGFLARRTASKRRAAVLTLQGAARGFLARRTASKRRAAVLTLQGAARGFIQRKDYLRRKSSVIVLQAHWRGALVRICNKRMQILAVSLQSLARGWLVRKRLKCLHFSAVKIQAVVRGHIARCQYERALKAVIALQAHVRMHLARRNFLKIRKSMVYLQSYVRGYLKRRAIAAKQASIVKVQSCIRAHFARKRVASMRASLVRLQSCVRGWLCRREYAKRKQAVIVLQAHTRRFLIQKHYHQKRRAAILLQAGARGVLARKHYHSQVAATVALQAFTRGYLARRKAASRRTAVVIIQASVKMFLYRTRYLRARRSVIVLQALARGYLARRRYKKVCLSVLMLQASCRGWAARRQSLKKKKAIVLLQSHFKAVAARRRYLSLRNAAVTIQEHAKRFLERRQLAAVRIQSSFRARRERARYLKLYCSVLLLQSHIRTWLARKRYIETRRAICRLQALARGRRTRVLVSKLCCGVTLIQARARGRALRLSLHKQHRAAAVLQGCYRRRRRAVSLQAHSAAAVIQRAYRCHVARKRMLLAAEEKHRVELARAEAAVCIQRAWRKSIGQKKQLLTLCKQRNAATLIQAVWRGYYVRKNKRSADVKRACDRVMNASTSANKSQALARVLPKLLQELTHCTYLSTAASLLARLERITEVSEVCSQEVIAYNSVPVLLNVVVGTNRNRATLLVTKIALRVLSNLAKWKSTSRSLFASADMPSVLVDLMGKTHTLHHDVFCLGCCLLSNQVHHSNCCLSGSDMKKLQAMAVYLKKKAGGGGGTSGRGRAQAAQFGTNRGSRFPTNDCGSSFRKIDSLLNYLHSLKQC